MGEGVMDEIKLSYQFGQGFVQNRNVSRVISQLDELANLGSTSSSLMMWSEKRNQWYHYNIGWTARRLTCSSSQMYALGREGRLLIAGAGGVSEEFATDEKERSPDEVDFRDMALIDNRLYITGRGRRVLRRNGPNEWVNWDNGLDISQDEAGFNAIDALTETDIYAVGTGGEIWNCREAHWRRVKSPAQSTLHNVKVIEPGLVYVAGANGVLLRGNEKGFNALKTDTDKDLYGIESFAGRIYVASEEAIFVLDDKDQLRQLSVGYGPCWTFKHLHANDGAMWSFGKEHLFKTTDGEHWDNVTPSSTTFEAGESGPAASHSSCGCTGGAHSCS